MEPLEKTINKELEEVKQEVCDKICKYTDGTIVVTDNIIETYCDKCPLTRL